MAASLQRISVLLLLFLQASFPFVSSAQQPSASATDALQLTLKEAVGLALKQNPQRIIAQLLVSESDRNSQIARSVLLPQASIAASGSLSVQYSEHRTRPGAKSGRPVSVCRSWSDFRPGRYGYRRFLRCNWRRQCQQSVVIAGARFDSAGVIQALHGLRSPKFICTCGDLACRMNQTPV
jgi:hypothetical protein